MNTIYLLPFLVAVVVATLNNDEWEDYKKTYGKSYKTAIEEQFRLKIFLNNKAENDRHNALFEQGLSTYTRGINQFTDMTTLEFSEMMNGDRSSEDIHQRTPKSSSFGERKYGNSYVHNGETAPDSLDWRTSGCVAPVKDQGQCGSCWAFSVVASVESQNCFKKSKLVTLSEQQLVDCGGPYGLNGCQGSNRGRAMDYIILNGGVDRQDTYPYEAKDGPCRFNSLTIGGTASSRTEGTPGCEECLKDIVSSVGPISVGIDAGHASFQHYKTGVYYELTCTTTTNHAVLLVGYGRDNGQDYWLVKNSWGVGWGEQGYIRMSRNKNNNCGIATYYMWPKV